jgi:hypothetical protein
MRNLEALDGEEACLKACSLVCKEWSRQVLPCVVKRFVGGGDARGRVIIALVKDIDWT